MYNALCLELKKSYTEKYNGSYMDISMPLTQTGAKSLKKKKA